MIDVNRINDVKGILYYKTYQTITNLNQGYLLRGGSKILQKCGLFKVIYRGYSSFAINTGFIFIGLY
jgi:hypothetical protein